MVVNRRAVAGIFRAARVRSPGLRAWFGLFSILALTWGCAGGGDEGVGEDEAPKKRRADVDKKAEVAAAPPVAEDYSYNPIGKRDPFRSFIARDVVAPLDAGELGPLQMWELDQFRLVAIVWGQDRSTAMVQDPEGIGHVVEVGTLIGKNWGRVTQIRAEELVVTEEYRDEIENRLIVNEIPVKLPSQEQAGGRG